ncbi:MAG: pertactin-like passenger domain-containing protein, partial [Acidaminococcaceae bacterium]
MKKNKLAATIILGLILTTLPYGQAAAADVIGREITTNDVTVTDPVSVTNTSTTGEDTYGIKVTGQLGSSAITGIKLAGTTITATTAHDQVYALHAKHSVTTVAAGSTLTAKNEWTGDTNVGGSSAIGVDNNQADLTLGANVTVNSTSSTTSKYGGSASGISHGEGKLDIGDNLTVTAQASGQQVTPTWVEVSSKALLTRQDAITTLGANATLTAIASGTGNIVRAYAISSGEMSSQSVLTLGAHTTLRAEATGTAGKFIQAYGLQNGDGVANHDSNNTVTVGEQSTISARVTVTAGGKGRAYGINNNTKNILNLGNKTQVVSIGEGTAEYISTYGVRNATGSTTATGDVLKLTWGDQLEFGAQTNCSGKAYAYGLLNDAGSDLTIGKDARFVGLATSPANYALAYGLVNGENAASTLTVGDNAYIGAQIDSANSSAEAYGICNKNASTLNVGDKATIVANTMNKGTAYGIYNAPGAKINLTGGFTLRSADAAIYNDGANSIINATAQGKDKIVAGDIYTMTGATTNLVLDTAASSFDGRALLGDTNTDTFNLTLANGATWSTWGNSQVSKLTLDNGSLVDMSMATTYRTLTVDTLSGNGGVIKLNTDLATGEADKVNIAHSTAGTQYLSIIDNSQNTGVEAQGELLLVEDKGNNIKFVPLETYNEGLWLRTPDVVVKTEGGNTKVYLEKIDKRVTNSVTSLLNITDSVYGAWVKNDTMRQRLGE